jgi:hypothetical protein
VSASYPVRGLPGWWVLTPAQVARWQTLYPRVDVDGECRKALAWLEANPSRQKTARGMPRFLVGWLARSPQAPLAVGDRAICPHAPSCDSPGNWRCQQRTVLEAARHA